MADQAMTPDGLGKAPDGPTIDPDPERIRLFISYGRRDASGLATRLRTDLEARGFDAWLDSEDLDSVGQGPASPASEPRALGHWAPIDHGIAEGIRNAQAVLALLSPHATRSVGDAGNPDGLDSVCKEELAYARLRPPPRPIVPVMAMPTEPPLLIFSLEYVDMVGWETSKEIYDQGLKELLRGIETALAGKPRQRQFLSFLKPLDTQHFLADRRENFGGRAWLFEQIEDWRRDRGERMLLITGDPGAGKSAVVAELVHRNEDLQVVAYHPCQHDRPESLDPLVFVQSIAAMLESQLSHYGAQAAGELEALTRGEIDPQSAWERAILAPLSRLAVPDGPARYIVIDALDEALGNADDDRNTIVGLLRTRIERMPSWLRIVATSRRERRILDAFGGAHVVSINAEDPRNRRDIEDFVRARLAEADLRDLMTSQGAEPEAAVAGLCAAGDGSFIYVTEALKAIEAQSVRFADLETLPKGLPSLYHQFFRRSFPTEGDYAPYQALLGVVLASSSQAGAGRGALGANELAAVLGESRIGLERRLAPLSGYLIQVDGGHALFHKSLADWLTDPRQGAADFLVDAAEGEARLLAYSRRWADLDGDYPLRHLPAHLARAGEVDGLQALLADPAFSARRRAADVSPTVEVEDYRALTSALVRAGRPDEVVPLATTERPSRRDGVALALREASSAHDGAVRAIAAALIDGAAPRSAGTAAGQSLLNRRQVGIRTATARGYPDLLTRVAQDDVPAVRTMLVPHLYRYWKRDAEPGWALLGDLAALSRGRFGAPKQDVLEVLGGVSLAILTRDYADEAVLVDLRSLWGRVARQALDTSAGRLLGRRLTLRVGVGLLTMMTRNQPEYQPLNLPELVRSFSRPRQSHARALAALASLEHPELGCEAVADALSMDRDLPYDVYLMLVAERALVVQGARAPAEVMGLVGRLYREGCPWFHQSCLYVAFHTLTRAPTVEPAWLDLYAELTRDFVESDRAEFAAESAVYSAPPHLATIEVVFAGHRPPARARFLPRYFEFAMQRDDNLLARRVLKGCELLSIIFGHTAVALDALGQIVAGGPDAPKITPLLEDCVVQTLANIRLMEDVLVDSALVGLLGRRELVNQVIATAPTVGAEEFHPGIDCVFNEYLVSSPDFRREICDAFRQAAEAGSAARVITDTVIRSINFLADEELVKA